jgi:hypothetical protein
MGDNFLQQLAWNQRAVGLLNERVPALSPTDNDPFPNANTPHRVDQPPWASRTSLCQGRQAGFAIPLQHFTDMEWTVRECP